MKISIVIPTYEYNGKGVYFLDRNLCRIFDQTFTNYEVVVSDHSLDNKIEDYCRELPVIYHRNTEKIGNSSANLNKAISLSSGDIIKPMFQDDFFFSKDALNTIHDWFVLYEENWVVCRCCIEGEWGLKSVWIEPYWNDDMVYGANTLSSPSCLAYRRCDEIWDERLIWLMDCEFYDRLYHRFGEPGIINDILVVNYQHKEQLTNIIAQKRKQFEIDLMKKEHPNGN